MNKMWLWLSLAMIPLYGFWTIPEIKNHKINQQDLIALQDETTDYQEKIKQLKDLDKVLDDPRYKNVLERVPATLEQETLIVLLKKIADNSGFVFDGLNFSRGQNPTLETDTLQVNFSIKGRKDQFPTFLQNIERSPRFMGIDAFAYSVDTINGVDVISMSVPLYTFAQSSEN